MQGIAPAKEHAKNVFHDGFAALGRQLQDVQVFLGAALRPIFFAQGIVGEPEAARRKQIFAVAVVLKRARLANQPINDVAIVDAMFAPPAQSRQLLHFAIAIPDFHGVGLDACFDDLTDQAAVH